MCNYYLANAFGGGACVTDSVTHCFVSTQRDGADYLVSVNTALDFDGCDSAASPDEAVFWGKITTDA